MLEFNILKGQYLNRLDKNVVSADTTDLKAQFDLTADFTGTITVWWRRSDVNNTYTSTLAADGTCTIPAEALAATDKAVYGPYDHDVFVSISDTGRTTTNEYKLTVLRSAFSADATPGTGGNPTAYEELVQQFDELKADNQTFKDDMTEQQETFESTVTENVDNIRYVVETETAPPIIEEASGAEITLDDSAYRQVRDLQLYGYSKQVQTTGAQLIPDSVSTPVISGVTLSRNDDGSFTLNGTNTSSITQGIYFVGKYGSTEEVLPKGNYFYKIDGLNEGDFCLVRGTDLESISSNPVRISQHNITQIGIALLSGTTYNNVKIYPMFNAGTSARPWEPYSGGVASPSPDWAQPIHSVADEVNLLNFPDVDSVVVDGVTWSCKGGVVSATGNATGQAPTSNTDLSYVFPIKAGTYKISGADSKTYIVAKITKSDDSITYPSSGFTLDGTEKEVLIYVRVASNGAISSTIYPMINSGATALPWRPYGHNVTVESQGANLIKVAKAFNYTNNGINVMALGDGTFSYSGTATDKNINAWIAGGWSATTPIITLRNGVYCASHNEALFYHDETYLNESNQISVANEQTVTGLKAPSAVVGQYYNKIIYPMLNRGSTPLPWQPYVAPSSALIALTDSLRGIPVTSGGNYTDELGQQWIADYIYRRQTDGKWMLWRNCGRVEYIGGDDENWTYEGAYFRFLTPSGVSNALVGDGRSMVICNRGLYHRVGVGSGYTFISNGPRFYYSPDPSIDSVDSFKTWLQSNPLEVVYQLATPTVEELPDDVQTELNELYTYNLHTDMWNNDGAYMNLKYVADTKAWINNKIAGLSTAMIENL